MTRTIVLVNTANDRDQFATLHAWQIINYTHDRNGDAYDLMVLLENITACVLIEINNQMDGATLTADAFAAQVQMRMNLIAARERHRSPGGIRRVMEPATMTCGRPSNFDRF